MSEYNRHWRPLVTKRGKGLGDNNWYMLTTTFMPSPRDIRQAQREMGFDHKLYGGPFDVDTMEIRQGGEIRYKSVWFSYSMKESKK